MLKIVIADSYDQVSEEAFKIMRQVVEKEIQYQDWLQVLHQLVCIRR